MGLRPYGKRLTTLKDLFLDLLYPPKCALCARIGQVAICPDCLEELVPLAPRMQLLVGQIDVVVSLYPFDGRAAQAVKRLKYNRATSLAEPMAKDMRAAYDAYDLDSFDVIVPVPISRRRLSERGFNQSDLLAEFLPAHKLRASQLLRIRHTKAQVGLKASERLKNLKGAFQAKLDIKGKSVLIVDDVTTTGGTAAACAEALRLMGATKIGLLTYCGERTSVMPTPASPESRE